MKRIILFIVILSIPALLLAPSLSKSMFDMKMKMFYEIKMENDRIKELHRFADYMYLKESTRQWWITNDYGYIGGYQFSVETLKHLGYNHISLHEFKKDPFIFPKDLQDEVFFTLIRANDLILKNYYGFIGSTIKNVHISKSGLLAAAHLGGAGSVILYLVSNGEINKKDAFGTSIKDYIIEFNGFNI